MRLTGAPIAYHTPSDTCARLSPKRRSRSNTAPLTPTSEMGSPSSGARHGSIRQALASSHELFQHSLEFTLLARHPFGRHLLERLVHHFLGEMHHALQPRLELRQRLHVLLNQFARIQTLHRRIRKLPVRAVEADFVVDHPVQRTPWSAHASRRRPAAGALTQYLATRARRGSCRTADVAARREEHWKMT